MRSLHIATIVTVASFIAGTPAIADAKSSISLANTSGASSQYWTASNEYSVMPSGVSAISGHAPRKVLISGWHPVAGFEGEIAEEAANRAASLAK